jgi:hypothetical protein
MWSSFCIEFVLHMSIERKSQNRTWNLHFSWNLGSTFHVPLASKNSLRGKKSDAKACDILLYMKCVSSRRNVNHIIY